MRLIGRILLVQVQLEEFVMLRALEVLVTSFNMSLGSIWASGESGPRNNSRVQLLEVQLDQVILSNFGERFVLSLDWYEITFAFEGTKVDLTDELQGVEWF